MLSFGEAIGGFAVADGIVCDKLCPPPVAAFLFCPKLPPRGWATPDRIPVDV